MEPPRDEIENRPPDLAARDRAYRQEPPVFVKNGRPAPTPAPSAVDQLAALVELVTALRADVAGLHVKVDEMAPRVAAAESSADMAHDEALAVRKAVDNTVIPPLGHVWRCIYNVEGVVLDIADVVAPLDAEDGAVINIADHTDTTPADHAEITPEDPK